MDHIIAGKLVEIAAVRLSLENTNGSQIAGQFSFYDSVAEIF
ncbi:hypothetical protein [Lacrimispora celerecrescens]|nr:hypothetical protein [Lacrimispora celerecrescens]